MRTKRPYPRHAFPELIPTYSNLTISNHTLQEHSKKTKEIISTLKNGARVLFDMKKGRGFIYRFEQGIKIIMELTTRILSSLVKNGYLTLFEKQGETAHFAPSPNLTK